MKRILHLDQNYQQLKLLQLFNSALQQFPLINVKKYSQEIISMNDNQSKFKNVVKILREQNHCTIQSLKMLMFYHTIIHENLIKTNQSLQEIVSEQINNIVALQNTRHRLILQSNERKSKRKGFSIDKAGDWLRQTFSRSKDKKEVRLNRVMSQTDKNLKNKSIEISQRINASANKNQSVEYTSVKNKQQLLIPKIILPYATYLLKLNSCQTNLQLCENLQTEQIWKIINLIKYLMTITHCFTMLMRYYSEYYQVIIRSLLKVIDCQLKTLYPFIITFVSTRLKQIKSQVLDVYGKYSNQQQIIKLQHISNKFQMKSINRIIEEILTINDQIAQIYRGKLTYCLIKEMNLRPLITLTQNDENFDLIFNVLQNISKNNGQNNKQITLKQKQILSNQFAQNKVLQIEKRIYPTSSKRFAQKKLKIVTESTKTTKMMAIKTFKSCQTQFTLNIQALSENQKRIYKY